MHNLQRANDNYVVAKNRSSFPCNFNRIWIMEKPMEVLLNLTCQTAPHLLCEPHFSPSPSSSAYLRMRWLYMCIYTYIYICIYIYISLDFRNHNKPFFIWIDLYIHARGASPHPYPPEVFLCVVTPFHKIYARIYARAKRG